MKLIVGLGNPGKEYEKTRHNFGFIAVDEIRNALKASSWKFVKKYNALFSEVNINGEKVTLMKPQTFMNLSGKAIGSYSKFYKIDSVNVCVLHDDKDLKLGKIRIRKTGSSGGHNGIQSIIDRLGTKDFWRFRLGIDGENLKNTTEYVLGVFRKKEKQIVEEILKKIIDEMELSLTKDEFRVVEFNILKITL